VCYKTLCALRLDKCHQNGPHFPHRRNTANLLTEGFPAAPGRMAPHARVVTVSWSSILEWRFVMIALGLARFEKGGDYFVFDAR
jgi:hypothetical protein